MISMAEKKNGRLAEIIRFVVTGGVCFLIEFAALVALRDGLKWNTLAAVPVAFLISVIVNYLLCMVWVFKGSKDGGNAARAGFIVTSLIGLGLNELLMWLLGLAFGEDTVLLTVFGFSLTMYMVNKVLATLLVMIWNYFSKRAVLKSGLASRLAGKKKEKK